jgi:NAD(P)-dependent dehydrogenase (short-subunit alcohol dehydrogenase family)
MKVAIVTGANRGLGFGTAEKLAKKGFHVVLTARTIEKATEAAQKIDGDITPMVLDASSKESIQSFAKAIEDKFDHLDVLVNNAGIFIEPYDGTSSVFTTPTSTIKETLQTNSWGPLRLTSALLDSLKKADHACVVNVSSGMGQLSEMGGQFPGYRLSKTALNAITRIMAIELIDTNVKVNCVCPGWVQTDMGGSGASRTLDEGTSGIVWAAMLDTDGPTGGFFRDGKELDW